MAEKPAGKWENPAKPEPRLPKEKRTEIATQARQPSKVNSYGGRKESDA